MKRSSHVIRVRGRWRFPIVSGRWRNAGGTRAGSRPAFKADVCQLRRRCASVTREGSRRGLGRSSLYRTRGRNAGGAPADSRSFPWAGGPLNHCYLGWPSGLSNDKNLGLRPRFLSTESLGPCFSHGMGDHDQILQPNHHLHIMSTPHPPPRYPHLHSPTIIPTSPSHKTRAWSMYHNLERVL